ncbi:ATP-binding protein [Luteimonas sp. S4-F44]|uniref:sensor histidine kinase n=1 Tax=Luteimonas sp. S4-F44 TaxID=2925842 RepID=UPI001F533745|nr:ATP-binding protein [Luteimonas sp. S4-F44]UNK42873.1 ATP-binding protein [Luteimonas sp. S4-F44]
MPLRRHPVQRAVAAVLIAAGLVLLGLSYARYGLAAQSGSVMLSILPLLFAGLLLGRRGLWAAATAYLAILLLGARTDMQHLTPHVHGWREFASYLLQPVLANAIVALILDRLILKSDIAARRNRELTLICRHLELEIRDKETSQAQLLQSQRIDALGKLAGNVAHDFNNLLGVILGFAQRGLDHRVLDDETRHCLQRIEAAARRGRTLTSKLLTLVRNDAALHEIFDANRVLDDLQPMLQSIAGQSVEAQTALCDGAAWVRMDRAEFEAAVLNLAKNAVDAMPGGGRMTLTTELEPTEVHLQLEDTGHGMSAQTRARIFEPFFTTKPRERGSGIGLAMVHRIVTEAGGTIDCDSAPGAGARFVLKLPLQAGPSGAAAAAA